MNKRIFGSIAAIITVLGLIGGGTFATWSNYDIVPDNEAGAGSLVVDAGAGAVTTIGGGDFLTLAPGENKTVYRYVASRSDQTVALQDALLTLEIENIEGTEDGCAGNSEKDQETADGVAQPCDWNGGNPFTPGGQFAEQAYLQVRRSTVVGENDCNDSVSTSAVGAPRTLNGWDTGAPATIAELDPDQGVCIAFELGLPNGDGGNTQPPGVDWGAAADNAVMGDSATFDVRFVLTQQ